MRTSRPNASSQALPRTERLRRTVWLIFGSLVILTLVSCKPNTTAETTYIGGRTMGTTFSIKYAGSVAASDLFDAASAELERVDAQMSTYRADSELSRFNAQKSTEWFDVSLETAQVTKRALKVSKATDGAYDPTVHPLVELWGFGPSKSSRTKFTPPSEEQISATKKRVGYAKVEARLAPPALRKLDPEVTLDLSSIAKGHGVDRLAALAEEYGAPDYFVDIGGEVRVRGLHGDRPWRVGVERPLETSKRSVFASFDLAGAAMATSGDYRQFFEHDGKKYGHSIDARTGSPVSHDLRSVSVFANTCEEADAWATALMVLGPETALRVANEKGLAAYLLIDDKKGGLRVEHSTKWALRQAWPVNENGGS